MKVLVTHPGLQHAHQLAWALEDAGHLGALWSGVPIRDPREPPNVLSRWLYRQIRKIPIPSSRRNHNVLFPLLRRLIIRLLPPRTANAWNHRLDHVYDAWIARRVAAFKPDVVVCYENSALRTFRAAKTVGAICVLDAASVHHEATAKWISETGQRNPQWIDLQKQQEIEQADAVLTCSEFAAETYRAAGVRSDKLFPIPLGTDLSNLARSDKVPEDVCRFVFVGSLMRRKSVDLILDIFEQFLRDGIPARLTLIGGASEIDLAKRANGIPGVTHLQFIPQPALFEEILKHDVLLLPSRFDSFGMVIPEAMSVGVPALVSDRVGAKCIIEAHPGSGWVVPCDADSIRHQIIRLINQRELISIASATARRAAQDYSWPKYRARVVARIESIYSTYKGVI